MNKVNALLLFVCILFASPVRAGTSPFCTLAGSRFSPEYDLTEDGCRTRSSSDVVSKLECGAADDTFTAVIFKTESVQFFQSFIFGGFENSSEWPEEVRSCISSSDLVGNDLLKEVSYFNGALRRIPISIGKEEDSLYAWIAINGQSSRRNQNDFLIYLFSRWAGTPDKVIDEEYVLNTERFDDYSDSDVMVAGQLINNTDTEILERAIVERGWIRAGTDCHAQGGKQFGCLHSTTKFSDPANSLGIHEISVEQFFRRVEQVNYYFDTLANYTSFIEALDAKYGKSTRKSELGCTHRKWLSGSVRVYAYYCPLSERKFRIEIFDLRVYDERQISEYAADYAVKLAASTNKTRKRNVPLDMF